MNYWWVNHKLTHKYEISDGFLWSPKLRQGGASLMGYTNMTRVKPGDIVFSFANAKIQAIGIVTSKHQSSQMPEIFRNLPITWSEDGWHVEVNFEKLTRPIRIKESIDQLAPLLASEHSPINSNGRGNQSMYLSEVSESLAEKLIHMLSDDFHLTLAKAGGSLREYDEQANEVEKMLEQRSDIGTTQIIQLVRSRRGQGVFKTNLKHFEKYCRVTKLDIQNHLIASHIKPWVDSTDFEKLDGNNGLLLSPHVDHLFNFGYISIENSGQLIISKNLLPVLSAWHIDPDTNVGNFNRDQQTYLEYHRDVILREVS